MSTSAESRRGAPAPSRATWGYLLFAVVVGGLNWATTAVGQEHPARGLVWTDLVLALAALVAVPLRRSRPLLVTTEPGYETVVMGIQRLAQSASEGTPYWHLVMTTAILAILPPVAIVVGMQKLFVKGLVEAEK